MKRGFELLTGVREPMSRAIAMMVLVTETHPFDDGNGRVARLTAHAELSAAGEVRIVVPTVYRNNYLAGLTGVSNGSNGQALAAILEYAQKWTAMVDWSSFEAVQRDIGTCGGFLDPGVAEAAGRRLLLPGAATPDVTRA